MGERRILSTGLWPKLSKVSPADGRRLQPKMPSDLRTAAGLLLASRDITTRARQTTDTSQLSVRLPCLIEKESEEARGFEIARTPVPAFVPAAVSAVPTPFR